MGEFYQIVNEQKSFQFHKDRPDNKKWKNSFYEVSSWSQVSEGQCKRNRGQYNLWAQI